MIDDVLLRSLYQSNMLCRASLVRAVYRLRYESATASEVMPELLEISAQLDRTLDDLASVVPPAEPGSARIVAGPLRGYSGKLVEEDDGGDTVTIAIIACGQESIRNLSRSEVATSE